MKYLVKYPITDEPGSGHVYVEVDEPEPTGGTARVSRGKNATIDASESFTEMLAQIKPAVAVVISTLREVTQGVSEISLQFGITVSGEFHVPAIASLSAEAQYSVSVKWQPMRPVAPDSPGS